MNTKDWCGRFDKCDGCKLQSECAVRPEELFIVFEDGKPVDRWAIRTSEMIKRELEKEKC